MSTLKGIENLWLGNIIGNLHWFSDDRIIDWMLLFIASWFWLVGIAQLWEANK